MGARARTCWVLLCRVKVSQHIDLSFFLTWLSLTPNWWDLLFSLSLRPGSLLHFKLQVAAPSLTGCRKAGTNGPRLIWWCEVTVGKMNYTQPHWLHRDLGNDYSNWVKWSCPWDPNNSNPRVFLSDDQLQRRITKGRPPRPEQGQICSEFFATGTEFNLVFIPFCS